jgi:hypothetical protein
VLLELLFRVTADLVLLFLELDAVLTALVLFLFADKLDLDLLEAVFA